MTREEVLKFVDNMAGAKYDFPFEGDFYSAVLRRSDSGKWFGIVIRAPENYFLRYEAEVPEEKAVLCLKCPPDLQDFLKVKYRGKILPAYHMNKKHWISVVLQSDVPQEETEKLLELAFEVTR